MDAPFPRLPSPLTPLVGRDATLAELRAQLQQPGCRLLTLTGPPGVGKTRLALALAAELDSAFPDRAWFASLASLRDPGLVAASIAKAVGLREEEGFGALDRALLDHLRTKELLLVLDNFEHVRGASGLVAELLRASPRLRVLVTSQVALRLSGELEHPVPPLELPPAGAAPRRSALAANPAVALFVARARAVQPELALTEEATETIARVCRRLEGIPLAIELAAARCKLFSPQGLLSRLDQRFAVLTHGARDLPARQQSLQAALDWSYELLAPEEQRLLRRAAVFARSFTLESAEAICDDDRAAGIGVADGMQALLDHSLLQAEATGEGGVRFVMLDTIGQYALARLHREEGATGAPQALRRRHALHFVEMAEAAEQHLRGAAQPEWVRRLDAEHDNMRAALAWCVELREAESGCRLAGALWRFWLMRGHLSEARSWLESVLDIPGPASLARAKALCGAGIMARFRGDSMTARTRLVASERLARTAGSREHLAEVLIHLGSAERYLGDAESAHAHLEESLELWRRSGDRWGLAHALSARAGLANDEGDYAAGQELRAESLQLYQAVGDRHAAAQALLGLGEIARCREDDAAAREYYERALEQFRTLGNRLHAAVAVADLGYVLSRGGRQDEALSHFIESVHVFRALGHQVGVAVCFVGLAGVEAAEGHPRLAAWLLGSAEHVMRTFGTIFSAADRAARDRAWAAAAAALGEEAFAAARAEGAALSVDEVLARIVRDGTSVTGQVRAAVDHGADARPPGPALSSRETAVLRLLAEGLSYAAIGQRLSISPRTVDAHLRSIYGKLGVGSRHEAVLQAGRKQLI